MPPALRGYRVRTFSIYLLCIAAGSVAWETAHMPLYTLWTTGTKIDIAKDVLLCTGNNLAIAAGSLAFAVWLSGPRLWPGAYYGRCAMLTCSLAVGYTAFSEWLNVQVLGTWGYSEGMPVVPGLGLGVSPLIEWVALPAAALVVARPRDQYSHSFPRTGRVQTRR